MVSVHAHFDLIISSYCLDNVSPADDDIRWWCSDCRGEDIIKAEPLRKSERISVKRQNALNKRNHWKQKLKRKRRLVRISNGIHEVAHLPTRGLETNLADERQRDLDILEMEKSIPEIASNSITNEPTRARNSNFPDKQEHNMDSFDEAHEIPEFGNNEKTLLLKDSDIAQYDGKDVDLQVSVVANHHSSTSDTLCRKPYLEPDDSLSADPIMAPVWRGWFNIKEESEICVEILAHLSNKSCLKVSDAAATLPPMLDVILLDKHVAWPKSFRAAPPTAASIGLYFFPACERDERVYDSLLEEVIKRELILKVMLDNVELLIFSSSELPLQHWRFNSKYFLWGVFKTMRNYSTTETSTSMQQNNNTQPCEVPEPTTIGNEEDLIRAQHADHLSTPSQPYQSPVSMKSSQASNAPPSIQNTPESLSLELSKLEKTVRIR
ncbi:hypothetical protein C2S53_020314 [Perilla frutescens var. hirtella]|uniref:AIPP2-like SPOC-like domain-containing protein n=1 Tax=Perilla frutescens var. hirtella TaxID=608512 RepID=A0AAD4JQV2_PERFH|nr:hypothetical protein C2S53_020314 [Perilla frutescens var. hirtella]